MLCYCFGVGSQSLALSLSLCLCVRDDLFRVELDNVVGEEMFYSKVRTETHTHTRAYTQILCAGNEQSLITKVPSVTEEDMGIQQK